MKHEIVVALLLQDNKILLGHRSPNRQVYPNVWDVFGGHMEPGEDQPQTLVRELQEELGIVPIQWRYIETLTAITPEESDEPSEVSIHFYLVNSWSGIPTNLQPHEHTEIQWLSLSQAIQLDLADPIYPQLFARYLWI